MRNFRVENQLLARPLCFAWNLLVIAVAALLIPASAFGSAGFLMECSIWYAPFAAVLVGVGFVSLVFSAFWSFRGHQH